MTTEYLIAFHDGSIQGRAERESNRDAALSCIDPPKGETMTLFFTGQLALDEMGGSYDPTITPIVLILAFVVWLIWGRA